MPLPGLVGWWQLLDGSGTIATDSSGNGNNGNLVGGPTWITTGPNGGGLSFRGGTFTDSVRIPRAPVLEPAAFTVSAWIKGPQAQDHIRQSVFGKAFDNDNTVPFQSYQLAVNNGGPGDASLFVFGSPGSVNEIVAANTVSDNLVWQNFVGTYDPAGGNPEQRFYLDGSVIGINGLTFPVVYDTTPAGDLYIAANSDLSVLNKTYQGSVTDVQVYNRALSAEEVGTIYGISKVSILRGSHGGSRMTPPYNP
jgi:hypothetical protein